MKKKMVLDKDEETLIAEYERGAFRPVKNQVLARKAARRYTQGRPDQYSLIDS